MIYYCFNIPTTDDCGSPHLNLPHITIDDIPHLDKRACYIPDMLPSDIFVASKKYVSNLTNPYDYPQVIAITFDDNKPHHATKKDNPVHRSVKRGYYYRRQYGKRCNKKSGFIAPHVIFDVGNFITAMDFLLH